MVSRILLKVSAGATLLYGIIHGIGHFRKGAVTREALTVLRAMEEYRFPAGGRMCSYYDIYQGMSLGMSVSLVAVGIMLWLAASATSKEWDLARRMLWPILIFLVGYAVAGWFYFFPAPAITATVSAILVAVAMALHRH
jgi:hypothetical protein